MGIWNDFVIWKPCKDHIAFSKDETMDQMIESCIPFMIKDGQCSDEETARVKMMEFMPNLKRWRKD